MLHSSLIEQDEEMNPEILITQVPAADDVDTKE